MLVLSAAACSGLATTGGLPPLPTGLQLKLATRSFEDAGVGGRVWASAPVLCEWLSEHVEPGDAVLELGSGTGAVGLYAAALGASRVVLTDGGPPALLELLAANVVANQPLLPDAVQLEVAQLSWGADAACLPAGPFTWVCGSDTTYDEEAHGPLCETLRALLLRARRDGERAPRAVLAMEHMEPLECRAAGSRFRDGGVEDFREVAEACGLALRWCPPATTAGVGAGSLPEMAGDTPESPPEFTWPLEAFADACPFVVELVLSADEAACTEPDGVL